MLLRPQYTCFLIAFVACIGVNLLIIRIQSSYVPSSVLASLQAYNSDLSRELFDTSIVNVERDKITALPSLRADRNLSTHSKQVLDICAENNLRTAVTRRNFLYSSENHGLYCWIRKAGSTSFTKLFTDMKHRRRSGNYYREIPFLSPKIQLSLKSLIKNPRIFKLLVVRHPFERIVSAYRDRIEDNSKYTAQSWIHVPKIFHLTRPDLFVTVGMFDRSLSRIFHEDKRLKLVPTFQEFITWLLLQDSTKDDPHWNQYFRHCSLCSVRFDYVLKLDNYTKKEVDYIFDKLHLNNQLSYLPKLEQSRKGITNFDVACNYFKNLSKEAVVNLYEKYRIDFEMFNYEFSKYFECTGD
ncbi:carbohydrate sulfotransferase 11-like [Phymastichus coffea]|uniref:carbohydrate sulfotransferase 11-like n=1 Tax=Phymastichus coffea TaxID=108790 RepID=UPI00273BDF98|nr:carbohydrate sulfotransferase 11-like [Phymastichus coffea]